MEFWKATNTWSSVKTTYLKWEWNVDKGYFSTWNKKTESVDKITMKPFIVLNSKECMKWYHTGEEMWAYSNEIELFDFKKKEFSVRCKEKVVVKWFYSDIKDELKANWVKLNSAINILMDWEVYKVFVKWLMRAELNELMNEKWQTHFLEFDKSTKEWKWIKYSHWTFKVGVELKGTEIKEAMDIVKQLTQPVEAVIEEVVEEDTDMPF